MPRRCFARFASRLAALALIGVLAACEGEFILALGFGGIWAEAGQQALSSLLTSYATTRKDYVLHWQNWQRGLKNLDEKPREKDLYRASAAVLRTHESKDFLGGIIASLSIPWGFNKGDEDLGGYHLIWPRDLVESAGGLLAAGAHDDALRGLHYLEVTQEADGHWAQNMWLDGRPYWNGLQMQMRSDQSASTAGRRSGKYQPLTTGRQVYTWVNQQNQQ